MLPYSHMIYSDCPCNQLLLSKTYSYHCSYSECKRTFGYSLSFSFYNGFLSGFSCLNMLAECLHWVFSLNYTIRSTDIYSLTHRMSLPGIPNYDKKQAWAQKMIKNSWLVLHIPGTKIEHPWSCYPLITFHFWPDTRRQWNTRQLQRTGWCCYGWKLQVVRNKSDITKLSTSTEVVF